MAYNRKKEHAFKTFQKDLKADDISGLVVFTGDEEYLINWAKENLINKYVNSVTRTLDLDVIDSDDYDVDRIIASCETVPMMSEKKVVVLRDYDKPDTKKIGKYCENIPDTTILILIVKKVDKALSSKGKVYDFGPLDKAQLESFIHKRFKERNKEISKGYIATLINESGYYNKDIDYTLSNMIGDIAKIAALADGDEIKSEDIRLGISDNLEHGVFTLIDNISNGKKDVALGLLHQIVTSGEDEIKLLAIIISQLEIMLMTKELLEDGWTISTIAKHTRIHEFRIKKAANFCKKYSVNVLKDNLKAAYNTDVQIKRGILDSRLALELLIAKI